MAKIEFLDTTLRDGAQAVGISYSDLDKKTIFTILDEFGIDLIEGGDPTSNPKDSEFFANTSSKKLVAFSSTHRKGVDVKKDTSLNSLVEANTSIVSIYGKASAEQAINVLGITKEENLDIIKDSVKYLVSKGKRVIFDAEHFFDSYMIDDEYALSTLNAAANAGADTLVLCDTNGGNLPDKIFNIVRTVVNKFPNAKIGIHAHNDCGMAVASSIMAVEAGATHVQGTFLGFGERCGNANLSTIIPNLVLKGHCETNCNLELLTKVANHIAEISNITLDHSMPYVGSSAFSHKGGTHSDAVLKYKSSFEHVSPEVVGNEHQLLISEMAGRSVVINKLINIFPNMNKDNPKVQEILDEVKLLESKGYQFENADASFILLAKKMLNGFKPSFKLVNYTITATNEGEDLAKVSIKVGDSISTVEEKGNGPVNALDKALRKALEIYYPQIEEVSLIDYKVRVVDSASATKAIVRVLITSKDKTNTWTTVGVSTDIIEASWDALVDSIEYKLSHNE